MVTDYNSIGLKYTECTHRRSYLLSAECYTYFNIIGDVAGKSILDLGCGDGFYSRKFKQKGAAKVVGVDTSEKMVELARAEEAKYLQKLEYIVCDVGNLGKIGSFDLVVASFLLNYASTKEQLLQICQMISTNLKPEGRFVSINNNVEQPPEFFEALIKYGYTKSIPEPLQEGTPITLTFISPTDGDKCTIENYCLSRKTYEWAFQTVGFQGIRWYTPMVSPKEVEEFGQESRQHLIDSVPFVGIECWRSNVRA